MPDDYVYVTPGTLSNSSNPYTKINDSNPAVEGVRDKFRAITNRGDYLALFDNNQIPNGRYTEAMANDYRLTHFQGVQRLRQGKYLVISGGDRKSNVSQLFLVKMDTLKARGAWRSNLISGRIQKLDRMIGVVKVANGKWHAGGISVSGDLLAVPVYSTADSGGVESSIVLYHFRTPERPERLARSVDIVRPGVKAGAVALTKLPQSNHLLAAVWSDSDAHLPPRFDFYLSNTANILDGFDTRGKVTWTVPSGQLEGFGKFQNTNFIVQKDSASNYRLFLVGTYNTRFVSLGKDIAELYEVDFRDGIFGSPAALSPPALRKVANKPFPNPHFQFHFAAGGGTYIDPSGVLRLYSTYYWQYNSILRLTEFRPEPDPVLPDIDNLRDSWMDLYEDSDFKSRRLSIRDLANRAEFSNYEDLNVHGGPIDRGLSSGRFQIPQGKFYRLYDRQNFRGQHIDLVGTGKVENIPNFKRISLGRKVRSTHPRLRGKSRVNFGDRVASSRLV